MRFLVALIVSVAIGYCLFQAASVDGYEKPSIGKTEYGRIL
jgi:hypothetical protein